MSNVSIKISQLNSISASYISEDDFIPVVDSASLKTYKMTLGSVRDFATEGIMQLLGGSDGQILYNAGGTISGDAGLKFNYVSKSLQTGLSSSALGLYSHAEGYQTYTSGVYAHVEGYQTYAIGTASHAGGYQTYAYGDYQTVVGKYNVNTPNNTSSLFIVGGGTFSERKDILLVDHTGITVNGDVNFSGSLYKNSSIYVPDTASYAHTASYALNASGGGTQYPDITDDTYNHRIGINNPYPTYTLDVSGSIKASLNISASSFTGSLSGTSSYATTAQAVALAESPSNGNFPVLFTEADTNGNVKFNSLCTYNPTNETFTVNNVTATGEISANTFTGTFGNINFSSDIVCPTGKITSSGIILPQSSSNINAYALFTGSIFYSGSKLYIYTGTGAASGLSGWQTASLGG